MNHLLILLLRAENWNQPQNHVAQEKNENRTVEIFHLQTNHAAFGCTNVHGLSLLLVCRE